MEFCGKVVKKPFGVGSKSEREAVMLITDGGEYVLRRAGGNAFRDPELDRLVGKSVCCQGSLHGYTFFMSGWHELGKAKPDKGG
jgi:hypothetical protein